VRKQLSNSAPRSDDMFAKVVEHSVDGLLVIDAEGVVRFANPAAVCLFAGKTSTLVGSHLGTPAIHEPVDLILPGDKSTRHVEMRSTEIVWEGRPANLASLRDVTDRKRAEDALHQQAAELRARNDELVRFNRATVGREVRMVELKKEVNELCRKLGEAFRYRIAEVETPASTGTKDPL